jgi:glycine C-acetyltransferase
MLSESTALRDKLEANTKHFRAGMARRGFDIPAGDHPIVPIMLGDAVLATKMADMMLEEGVYVVGFSYPVVPKGKARIRVQISAAHSTADLDLAMNAFAKVRDACKG